MIFLKDSFLPGNEHEVIPEMVAAPAIAVVLMKFLLEVIIIRCDKFCISYSEHITTGMTKRKSGNVKT